MAPDGDRHAGEMGKKKRQLGLWLVGTVALILAEATFAAWRIAQTADEVPSAALLHRDDQVWLSAVGYVVLLVVGFYGVLVARLCSTLGVRPFLLRMAGLVVGRAVSVICLGMVLLTSQGMPVYEDLRIDDSGTVILTTLQLFPAPVREARIDLANIKGIELRGGRRLTIPTASANERLTVHVDNRGVAERLTLRLDQKLEVRRGWLVHNNVAPVGTA